MWTSASGGSKSEAEEEEEESSKNQNLGQTLDQPSVAARSQVSGCCCHMSGLAWNLPCEPPHD